MSGRVCGVLLLAIALAATAIGAGIRAHTVVGIAVSVPPPGPPAVGDCLTDPAATVSWSFQFDSGAPTQTYRPGYPAAQVAACRGTRFGEVVDVIENPGAVTVRRSSGGVEVSDPTGDRCGRSVRAYLGTGASTTSRFVPPELGGAGLLGPTDRQKSAGQHWAVCLVTALDDNGSPARLAGSVRDLWTTGAERDQLGACQVLVQWATGPDPGACGSRHHSEVLGYADLSAGALPTRAALETDCRAYAQRATGGADLTGSAALQVSVRVFADGSSLDTGRSITAQSLVVCGVETLGAAVLTSSLIAWGHHPLPLG